jgi:hypothetical protein
MPMSYKYTISHAAIASCLISWAAMLMVPSSKPTTQINLFPDIKTSNGVLWIQSQAHAVHLRWVNRHSKVIAIWSSSSHTRLADQWQCVWRNSMSYKYTISWALIASCLIWWAAMWMVPSSKLHKLCFCFQLAKMWCLSCKFIRPHFWVFFLAYTSVCWLYSVDNLFQAPERPRCSSFMRSITNWCFNLQNTEWKMSSSFPYFQSLSR